MFEGHPLTFSIEIKVNCIRVTKWFPVWTVVAGHLAGLTPRHSALLRRIRFQHVPVNGFNPPILPRPNDVCVTTTDAMEISPAFSASVNPVGDRKLWSVPRLIFAPRQGTPYDLVFR